MQCTEGCAERKEVIHDTLVFAFEFEILAFQGDPFTRTFDDDTGLFLSRDDTVAPAGKVSRRVMVFLDTIPHGVQSASGRSVCSLSTGRILSAGAVIGYD
jgi:hypothetical protein